MERKDLCKRVILFVLLVLSAPALQAQTPIRPPVAMPPAPKHYNVSFVSRGGEAFSVYIDGELQNKLPQSRVDVGEVSDQTHEVVVVLKRPVEKCAVLQLRPGEPSVIVNVSYNTRLGKLYLYTPIHNRTEEEQAVAMQRAPLATQLEAAAAEAAQAAELGVESISFGPDVKLHLLNTEQVDSLVAQMRSVPFDNDRLALGKVLVSASHLTSEQIARLAATIDFSSSQVEFLKYAYGYCIDPVNFYRTVDVLSFTSDKRKVLDYIATQR